MQATQKDPTFYYELKDVSISKRSQENELACWLVAIETHGESLSNTSQDALAELTLSVPNFETMPLDIQEGIEKINDLVQGKNWKELSPQSKKVLEKICSDNAAPNCARKLFF